MKGINKIKSFYDNINIDEIKESTLRGTLVVTSFINKQSEKLLKYITNKL